MFQKSTKKESSSIIDFKVEHDFVTLLEKIDPLPKLTQAERMTIIKSLQDELDEVIPDCKV